MQTINTVASRFLILILLGEISIIVLVLCLSEIRNKVAHLVVVDRHEPGQRVSDKHKLVKVVFGLDELRLILVKSEW